jgi:hypothetical protein
MKGMGIPGLLSLKHCQVDKRLSNDLFQTG